MLHKTYIEFLDQGFIQINNSLAAAALILFILEPRRGLCFYIDHKGFNNIIKKNYYALHLIKEMF